MADYQDSKALVLRFYRDLEAASPERVSSVLDRYTSSDYQFRGVHPFNELDGADAVAETVWKPLLEAFTPMQRRQDIFMAGTNSVDGSEWVTSMGKFMGLFDHDWLGIPASGKITFRLTGSDLDGQYMNAVTSITGTDISFVQCHDADGESPDESTVTFTVDQTTATATETGVVDECA